MKKKTGRAALNAAVKRLFSATFDQDEPLPEDVMVKREDLEAVLLTFKDKHSTLTLTVVPEPPQMHPEQQ